MLETIPRRDGRTARYPQLRRPSSDGPTPAFHRCRKFEASVLSGDAGRQTRTAFTAFLDSWRNQVDLGLSASQEVLLRRLANTSQAGVNLKDVTITGWGIVAEITGCTARGERDLTQLKWGQGVDTVRRTVRQLVEAGWLEVQDELQMSPAGRDTCIRVNRYRFTIPARLEAAWQDFLAARSRRGGRQSGPARQAPQARPADQDRVAAAERTAAAQRVQMAANDKRRSEYREPTEDERTRVRQRIRSVRARGRPS